MLTRSWSLLAAGLLVLASGTSAAAQSAAPPSPEAVASGAPAASAPTGTFGAAWESVSCDTFDVNEKAAATADCGYVTVPENRAAGTADTIQLAVVRLRSASAEPGEPVVIGTGGPGGSGLDFLSKENLARGFDWTTIWGPVLADRDVVRFSQRGTQYARPFLECPEYDAIDFELRSTAGPGADRRRVRTHPQGLLRRLRRAGRGPRTAYNQVENAADIVDIKDALGYDTIAFYGESYGTLLGQFLMRDHPEVLERGRPRRHRTGRPPALQPDDGHPGRVPAHLRRLRRAGDLQGPVRRPRGDRAEAHRADGCDADPTVTVKGRRRLRPDAGPARQERPRLPAHAALRGRHGLPAVRHEHARGPHDVRDRTSRPARASTVSRGCSTSPSTARTMPERVDGCSSSSRPEARVPAGLPLRRWRPRGHRLPGSWACRSCPRRSDALVDVGPARAAPQRRPGPGDGRVQR